jgi:L-rhamnose-H+ transport protein
MQVILGVLFHFIGGFASGSFYIPYKKVKGWSWESYWLIGGLFSWLIVPPLAAYLTIPGFRDIITQTGSSTLLYTYIFGLLWGIGGLTYGLGVRYLGVSLGSSIILGLCMVFGSLIPSVYYQFVPEEGKDTIGAIAGSTWGLTVLAGLAICIFGIYLCGKAGTMKERQMKSNAPPSGGTPKGKLEVVREKPVLAGEAASPKPTIGTPARQDVDVTTPAATAHGAPVAAAEYKFGLGLTVAIISGVLSACFNFGLEAGKPMADAANAAWKETHPGDVKFLYGNNVVYILILWGGLTTNLIWCLILNARNKTFGDYTTSNTPLLRNYIFCALAGTTWFLQFFFYGMGESKLGNGASSWILHMAFIILIANMWGLLLKEWKGVSKKTRSTVLAGVLTIIFAVLVVGYGNHLEGKEKEKQAATAAAAGIPEKQ